jgi:hypothetical protein
MADVSEHCIGSVFIGRSMKYDRGWDVWDIYTGPGLSRPVAVIHQAGYEASNCMQGMCRNTPTTLQQEYLPYILVRMESTLHDTFECSLIRSTEQNGYAGGRSSLRSALF